MKFGSQFTRIVDSGTPANTTLGLDAANFDPRKDHTANIQTHGSLKDCIYETRLTNINGFPAQRVVVGYMPPAAGVAIDLQATMYMQDDLTGFWYAVAAAPVSDPDASEVVTLPAGGMAYFDTPCMPDNPNTNGGAATAGSLRVILIVSIPLGGTANDGTHTFAIGTDVSNPGL